MTAPHPVVTCFWHSVGISAKAETKYFKRMTMPLTQREIEVLITVVEDYITNAAPVGSRTVAKKSGLRLSPASMRNTMADLTDKGYLGQPHTSSGRVPTLKAFRFYLDSTLQPAPLPEQDQVDIMRYLDRAGLDLNDILSQATRLVSSLSNQLTMVLSPDRDEVRLREIDFTLIKPRLILAVLILEGGIVQNKLLEVDEELTKDDLRRFSNYLNEHYQGLPLSEARVRILSELQGAKERLQLMYQRALRLARHALESARQREVYVEGTVNMLNHVEFSNIARMRDVLNLIEERGRLLELLDKTIVAEEGARVTLGGEADLEDLSECSVISAPYGGDSMRMGVVGVIGPVRMDYARVVPVVDYIAQALTHLLRQRF